MKRVSTAGTVWTHFDIKTNAFGWRERGFSVHGELDKQLEQWEQLQQQTMNVSKSIKSYQSHCQRITISNWDLSPTYNFKNRTKFKLAILNNVVN